MPKTSQSATSRNPAKNLLAALAAAAAIALPCSNLNAAKVTPNAIKNQSLFAISVAGGKQEFYGKADLVLSVSKQEYTTGPLFVTEVTIDMMGSDQLLRIYTSRPVGVQDAAEAAQVAADTASELTNGAVAPTIPETPEPIAKADATAQRAYSRATASIVVKTYPVTTHAKTVEFSVSSAAELTAFYNVFRDLYANRDVRISNGNIVSKTTAIANAASSAAANPTGSTTTISRLGGVLFSIQ